MEKNVLPALGLTSMRLGVKLNTTEQLTGKVSSLRSMAKFYDLINVHDAPF